MKKYDLKEINGISSATIAKPGKGENITTDVLIKSASHLNALNKKLWKRLEIKIFANCFFRRCLLCRLFPVIQADLIVIRFRNLGTMYLTQDAVMKLLFIFA